MEFQRQYPLTDTPEPNLIEDIFPYTLPPLITFNGKWTEDIDGRQVTFGNTIDRYLSTGAVFVS